MNIKFLRKKLNTKVLKKLLDKSAINLKMKVTHCVTHKEERGRPMDKGQTLITCLRDIFQLYR